MKRHRFVRNARRELRQCETCPHRGRGDESATVEVCLRCKVTQPANCEDYCPTCREIGTMFTACPKCGAPYHLSSDWPRHVAAPRVYKVTILAQEGGVK